LRLDVLVMNDTTTGRQAAAILAELGWPTAIPIERLVASVYDRAMRSGIFEGEMILGYTFDRAGLPGRATREDRLTVAMYALCRFAADNGAAGGAAVRRSARVRRGPAVRRMDFRVADAAGHARPVRGREPGAERGQGRDAGRVESAEVVPRAAVIAPTGEWGT
jgi:hypothetical protein